MQNISTMSPIQGSNPVVTRVWYTGDDALVQGVALCRNTTIGTATEGDGKRHNSVSRPNVDNAVSFAGVTIRPYFASRGGQFVDLYAPGSLGVPVSVAENVTIGDAVTFTAAGAGGGAFLKGGLPGAGTAIVRQTTTNVKVSGLTGTFEIGTDRQTIDIGSNADVGIGSKIVLLGGEKVIPGVYEVAKLSSTDSVVVREEVTSGTASARKATGYVYNANPLVQADLIVGGASGGIQIVTTPTTGSATALDGLISAFGVTAFTGGVTVGTADANGQLPDGKLFGQQKVLRLLGGLTTNGVKATLATAGAQIHYTVASTDATPTALASIKLTASGKYAILEWYGKWVLRAEDGATLA